MDYGPLEKQNIDNKKARNAILKTFEECRCRRMVVRWVDKVMNKKVLRKRGKERSLDKSLVRRTG